jgi:hypothetical protein
MLKAGAVAPAFMLLRNHYIVFDLCKNWFDIRKNQPWNGSYLCS